MRTPSAHRWALGLITTWLAASGQALDFATARTETYARPQRRNDERRREDGDRPNRRRPAARRRPGGE